MVKITSVNIAIKIITKVQVLLSKLWYYILLWVQHYAELITHSASPHISFKLCGGVILIKKYNTRISVVIPKEIHKKLLEEAAYEDRSISNLVLKIIKEHYRIRTDD